MFYTLLKFLGWGLLLAVVGGCIGWALRALKCRGDVARARRTSIDTDEVDRMRHRLANLEQVVAERDRLRMQVADMRHTDSPGVVGVAAAAAAEDAPVVDPAVAEGHGEIGVEEGADVEHDERVDQDEPEVRGEPVGSLAVESGRAVLGRQFEPDDLTVVEGIGAKIAELCAGMGITTWRALADTEVTTLQTMLDDAGSRYRVHDPGSWPEQAGLLAEGRWDEFTALTEELRGGH